MAFYFHILTTMHGQNHIKTDQTVYYEGWDRCVPLR